MQVHPLTQASLDTLAVPYEVMDCDPDLADTAAFCEAYGVDPEDSANTILVSSKRPPGRDAACVVLATTRLDVNRRVRELLNVRKLSFASAERTMEVTDMLIGGVTPFGLPTGLRVLVDRRVMERSTIILGGGNRSSKLKVSPSALLELPAAEVIDDLAIPM